MSDQICPGFTDTGMDYAAFSDGRCVAIAVKGEGPRGLKHNTEVLSEFGAAGYEIKTLPRAEAVEAFRDGYEEREKWAP